MKGSAGLEVVVTQQLGHASVRYCLRTMMFGISFEHGYLETLRT
jgi:hypothetical protein